MIEPNQAGGNSASLSPGSPVVVLGVDTPIGVAILRDLGRNHIRTVGIGRSKYAIGLASRYCHQKEVRARGELELIEQLHRIASGLRDPALMAISENDNLFINRNRETLEPVFRVIAPEQSMLEQVLDKTNCIRLAQEVGIRVPDTFSPSSMAEIEERAKDLTYPRVIKWADPNVVSGALEKSGLTLHKCQYAHNGQDLIDKLRPYARINHFPLVQEYCPGHGIGQMFLVRNGKILMQFQHERIHEWPPEGGVSTLCKSVPLDTHRSCRERSANLLEKLQWDGVAMVEYRYDDVSGTYYFMEINGRFWGSLPLAIAAGVPFASGLVGVQTGSPESEQSAYAELYCRFMIPEVRRLIRLIFQPGKIQDPFYRYSKGLEVVRFFIDFFRPGMRYYLLSFDDPGPLIADIRNMVRKIIPL